LDGHLLNRRLAAGICGEKSGGRMIYNYVVPARLAAHPE